MVLIGMVGKKVDSDGNKIPNDQRMTYANIKVIKDGATIPVKLTLMQRYKN